jgi:hypothetical protein
MTGIADLAPVVWLLAALQAPPASRPPGRPADDRPGVSVRLETRAERFTFHVENPSNVEPGPLVPHFFEQVYDADNTWLIATAHYRLFGGGASTELGVTPRVTRAGSDVDTFFQPSGEVITSGTRGDVRLRSLAIHQKIEMTRWRGWVVGVTAGYRRSEMDFLPSDRIVTRSQPQTETREPVGGDETTWSHVLESGVTAAAPLDLGGPWRLHVDAAVLPLTRARLTISLPLKYPGELVRQDTFSFGARGRLAVERLGARVSAGAALTLGGAWGYRSTANYQQRQVGGDVFVRFGSSR